MTDSEYIDRLANGYRAAQAILAGHRLNLFDTIGTGCLSLTELVEKLEASPRGVRMLADALVALHVLEKDSEGYRNGPLAREQLTAASPRSRMGAVWNYAVLYERWGCLYDAVKTGKPIGDEAIDRRLLKGKEGFAAAMADIGRLNASKTMALLDLGAVTKLLDIGGGPGTFSIQFAESYPMLHALIVDDASTVEIAQGNIAAAGLGDRVQTMAGDIFDMEIEERFDFIFMSNLVHLFSFEKNRQLLSICGSLLTPGGRVCIKDFFISSDRTEPSWSALFALTMLLQTDSGDCYTENDFVSWFEGAGLRFEEKQELNEKSGLFIARTP